MNFNNFAFKHLLILTLTVSVSKLYFIFSHIFTLFFSFNNIEHYSLKMFLPSRHILTWTVTIYVFCLHFQCAVSLTITGKRLTFISIVFLCLLLLCDYLIFVVGQVFEFSAVRLFLMVLYVVMVNIFLLLL